jgi:hypothetical protein
MNVHVWSQPWLRGDGNAYITTDCVEGMGNMSVRTH